MRVRNVLGPFATASARDGPHRIAPWCPLPRHLFVGENPLVGFHGNRTRSDHRRTKDKEPSLLLPIACSTRRYTSPMGREISQRELRDESEAIMRELERGETFTITRHGVPVAELAPLRRRRFVTAEAATELFRSAPHASFDELRMDLDAAADQDSEPRA